MSLGALILYTHSVLNESCMFEHIHCVLAVGNITFDANLKPSQLLQLFYHHMEDPECVCLYAVYWTGFHNYSAVF